MPPYTIAGIKQVLRDRTGISPDELDEFFSAMTKHTSPEGLFMRQYIDNPFTTEAMHAIHGPRIRPTSTSPQPMSFSDFEKLISNSDKPEALASLLNENLNIDWTQAERPSISSSTKKDKYILKNCLLVKGISLMYEAHHSRERKVACLSKDTWVLDFESWDHNPTKTGGYFKVTGNYSSFRLGHQGSKELFLIIPRSKIVHDRTKEGLSTPLSRTAAHRLCCFLILAIISSGSRGRQAALDAKVDFSYVPGTQMELSVNRETLVDFQEQLGFLWDIYAQWETLSGISVVHGSPMFLETAGSLALDWKFFAGSGQHVKALSGALGLPNLKHGVISFGMEVGFQTKGCVGGSSDTEDLSLVFDDGKLKENIPGGKDNLKIQRVAFNDRACQWSAGEITGPASFCDGIFDTIRHSMDGAMMDSSLDSSNAIFIKDFRGYDKDLASISRRSDIITLSNGNNHTLVGSFPRQGICSDSSTPPSHWGLRLLDRSSERLKPLRSSMMSSDETSEGRDRYPLRFACSVTIDLSMLSPDAATNITALIAERIIQRYANFWHTHTRDIAQLCMVLPGGIIPRVKLLFMDIYRRTLNYLLRRISRMTPEQDGIDYLLASEAIHVVEELAGLVNSDGEVGVSGGSWELLGIGVHALYSRGWPCFPKSTFHMGRCQATNKVAAKKILSSIGLCAENGSIVLGQLVSIGNAYGAGVACKRFAELLVAISGRFDKLRRHRVTRVIDNLLSDMKQLVVRDTLDRLYRGTPVIESGGRLKAFINRFNAHRNPLSSAASRNDICNVLQALDSGTVTVSSIQSIDLRLLSELICEMALKQWEADARDRDSYVSVTLEGCDRVFRSCSFARYPFAWLRELGAFMYVDGYMTYDAKVPLDVWKSLVKEELLSRNLVFLPGPDESGFISGCKFINVAHQAEDDDKESGDVIMSGVCL